MSIIEKLKANVEAITGMPFVYGAQGDVNRAMDGATLPCVFAYLLENGQLVDENGILRERLTMVLFFVNKTAFDFESIENESIIDEMKRKAMVWYAANRIPDTLRFVSLNGTMRIYDELDAIVTGYALNVTFEEMAGVGRCDIP